MKNSKKLIQIEQVWEHDERQLVLEQLRFRVQHLEEENQKKTDFFWFRIKLLMG